MADGGGLRWEDDSFFTEDQVARILRELRLDVDGQTEAVFLSYCPFHGNRDTPSFAVNKTDGTYICFNPSCNKSGGMMRLIKNLGDMNDFQAKRLIARSKGDKSNIIEELEKVTDKKELWSPYRHTDRQGNPVPDYLTTIKTDMWKYAEPQLYMRGRGFEKQTLKDFEIGYDLELDMVCVPMHDPTGSVEVGEVRRSIEGKAFKNTPGLPTSKTLFNLHRAKKTGDAVIIVEASFDVMRLHQAGYPNAVGLLMGHFSKDHARLLGKYFNTITIMTDYDDKKKHVYKSCLKCKKAGSNLCLGHNPGEELGSKIAEMMSTKRIMWAHHGGVTRFPEGVKDVGDMDDEVIRHSVKSAVSNFEYSLDL
jgi:DNA primase